MATGPWIKSRACPGLDPGEQLGLWLGRWEGKYQGEKAVWLRFHTAEGKLVLLPAEAEREQAEQERQRAERQDATWGDGLIHPPVACREPFEVEERRCQTNSNWHRSY